MSKIILLDGRVAQSPEQLYKALKPASQVRRVRAVTVGETVEITEQGRLELEEIQASRNIETEVQNG